MLKDPKSLNEEDIYAKQALHNFHKSYGKQFGASSLSDYEKELTKLYKDILYQYKICNNNWDDSDSDEFDASGTAIDSIADDSDKINKIVHKLNL